MSDRAPSDFSPAARELFDILGPHTPFAESIVRRQVERVRLATDSVARIDLPSLVPLVIAASQGYVDAAVIDELKRLA
jgi:hypothetical protein